MNTLLCVVGGAMMVAGAWMRLRLQQKATTTWVGSSDMLKGTVFLSHLDKPLSEGLSSIWCIAFPLAWQKSQQVLGEAIQLERNQIEADRLNAWNGLTVDCVKIEVSPGRISGSFGLHLKLETPFLDNDQPLPFRAGATLTPVRSFGLRPGDANRYLPSRQQVAVLFRTGAEFGIDPCLGSQPFRLILAAVEPRETLLATIEYVRQRAAQAHEWRLGSRDSLLIPKQSWDILHHFRELAGPRQNPGAEGPLEARQRLRFGLDRGKLELASPQILKGLFTLAGRPCHYHFDRPFLLFVEVRDTGQVVLAMWVANPELLARWE